MVRQDRETSRFLTCMDPVRASPFITTDRTVKEMKGTKNDLFGSDGLNSIMKFFHCGDSRGRVLLFNVCAMSNKEKDTEIDYLLTQIRTRTCHPCSIENILQTHEPRDYLFLEKPFQCITLSSHA
jgi:hypothetical protein